MTFLPTGEIGVGKNAQESKWEFKKPYLLIMTEKGQVGRAFVYDRGKRQWVGTTKITSLLSSENCYIARPEKGSQR